ncbi:protein of unknown function [Hyphomicrobium sp. 1Nfss2.1]
MIEVSLRVVVIVFPCDPVAGVVTGYEGHSTLFGLNPF